MKTIRCHACGHENELQRVYCHNCGQKLDRSKIQQPKESKLREEAKRQVQKTLKPPYPYFRRIVLPVLQTLILAAITACLINMFTPGRMPEAPSDQERMNPPQIPLFLEQIISSPTGGRVTFTDKQLTAWLATQVRSNVASGLGYTIELDRVALECFPGIVRVYLSRKVTAGTGGKQGRSSDNETSFPIVVAGDYQVSLNDKDQTLSAKCLGIRVGRLWIPALIAQPSQAFLFADLGKVFQRDRKLLEKLHGIEVEKNRVTLSRGARE
ncbi:MAG: hypothetical protein SNJ52_05195 [Verrucomicrobiia bacterium]